MSHLHISIQSLGAARIHLVITSRPYPLGIPTGYWWGKAIHPPYRNWCQSVSC